MCELFALSSKMPTSVKFSLEKLAQHGEDDGPQDGWGIAFYEGNDVSLFREPKAISDSLLVRFIEQQSPPSTTIISHIRKATKGARDLRNTHPFVRELGGRQHVFAHNGALSGLQENMSIPLENYFPIGDTDSEVAFCILLERLNNLWNTTKGHVPPLEARLDLIVDFAADLRRFGPANFLYADASTLFVHAHRRHQTDGTIRSPGLHFLQRNCQEELIGTGVTLPAHQQEITLVASVPLTDELWQPLGEGEIIALEAGQIIQRLPAV